MQNEQHYKQPLRVGVGGPVGSGKTRIALSLAAATTTHATTASHAASPPPSSVPATLVLVPSHLTAQWRTEADEAARRQKFFAHI